MMKKRIKRIARRVLAALLAVCALGLYLLAGWLGGRFPSQQAAERWRGESELDFAQVSCFLPVDEAITLREVNAFREQISKALHTAAVDVEHPGELQLDAWSCSGKVNVSSELGKGEARVVAVGGDFFQFHPLRLLSGSYIAPSDLMQDRVLLDEELAWLLFGGTELSGLSLKLEGVPFVVAGVVAREQDAFSRRAYTGGMGLFMSYDAYLSLHEQAGIECYEYLMAEPVSGYALSVAKQSFPIGRGEIVQNTQRFSPERLIAVLKSFPGRSMQTQGIIYPYWENACRGAEDCCALLLLVSCLACVYPFCLAVGAVIRLFRRTRDLLSDAFFPAASERVEEAIRVRQRRRWEKKQGEYRRRA